MSNWQTDNNQSWMTKAVSSWKSDGPISWFSKLVNALWDSLGYTWDDDFCVWDASSTNDIWNVDNNGSWYTKN